MGGGNTLDFGNSHDYRKDHEYMQNSFISNSEELDNPNFWSKILTFIHLYKVYTFYILP